jgi:hypothetical protein
MRTARAFSLWLEFEHYVGGYPQPGDDPHCDFCNAEITADGQVCGITVWTFGFVEHARRSDEFTGAAKPEIDRFLLPPDLLVEKLDRGLIEEAIADLLGREPRPTQWLWRNATEENHA